MRRVIVIALCALSFLVALPAPAHAWFFWLDEYSGPGGFIGFDVQWRIACINDPAPRETARKWLEQKNLAAAINQALSGRAEPQPGAGAPPTTQGFTTPAPVTDKEAEDAAAAKRISKNPGDYVLRSLASFEGKGRTGAALLGVGCVRQTKANPIASLNVRFAYLFSLHNHLTYDEPEYAEDGPRVHLLQPEVSFTVFVDRRKSVELGSAMGVSTAFVAKKGVDPFSRFYWRPFLLTVSPVSLLRKNSQKGWRALTLTSSIVIMPQELNDTDFGAKPGTFHTDREIQGLFGVTLDLSRF